MQTPRSGWSGTRRWYAALGLVLAVAGGCATVPDADQSIAEADATLSDGSQVLGAGGSLTATQSRRLLKGVARNGQDALLQRHLAIEEAVAGAPLTTGNRTRLLRDGDAAFAAIFDAIRSARHHVNLEYYTLEDIVHQDERLSDLLIARRAEGVAVNIIYDSFGSADTPAAFFKRLKNAGANLVEFRPVNPLEAAAEGYSPNDRNHRKIMIVDGRVAVIGGINLARYYQSKIPGSDDQEERARSKDGNRRKGDLPETWRDLAIRIEGPAVAQLQRLFLGHWASEDGPRLDPAGFFPRMPEMGGDVVRIIGSSPQQEISRYYVTLVSAIRSAEQRIWLTTAYFVPTFEEKHALIEAAERGVDVRLMLPGASDASQAVAVARSHYADLLEAGVRIFEIDHVVLHSKAVTIDGVWSAVGSSNFDHRSVLFNDEVDAVVLGPEMAHALEAVFEEDRSMAREIELEEWRERPLVSRFSDFLQRMWQYVL